jgi:hypothetical protein
LEVTLTFAEDFNGTAKIAKAAEGATITEASFTAYNASSKPKYAFTDGDLLYVKVTASDGVSIYYYGYSVLIGSGTSLDTVNFETIGKPLAAEDVSVTLGEPKDSATATFAIEETGKIQFNVGGNSFKVTVVPNDTETTVKINKNGSETWSNNGSTLTFNETDTLFVFVTSTNGKVKKYYKFDVILQRSVKIAYGKPANLNIGDNGSVDAIWSKPEIWGTYEDDGWLQINRVNTTETQAIMDFDAKDRSFGRAKLLWDEDGVYIYAQVWEKNITLADGPSDSAYTKSSVELFICESALRTGTVASGRNENGGQYRLGANNVRSGPQAYITEAFNALDRSNAKKWESNNFPFTNDKAPAGTTVQNGYVVIFQAPWLFPDKYPLVDHKEITIELQINATNPEGNEGRVGVLNWNNANSNSYSSVANFGGATLELNGETMGAQAPTITTQPVGQRISIGTAISALTVVGASPDGGTLGYQWYSADDATSTGTEISGAESASFTPSATNFPVDTAVDYYFYVIVSNTKGGVTKSRESSHVRVRIYDPAVAASNTELLTANLTGTTGTSYGSPQHEIPLTVDLAEYVRMEIKYTIDGGTPPPSSSSNDWYFVIGSGGDVYNASDLLKEGENTVGLIYTFTEADRLSTSGQTIILKYKPATAGNNSKPYTITSVLLIAE